MSISIFVGQAGRLIHAPRRAPIAATTRPPRPSVPTISGPPMAVMVFDMPISVIVGQAGRPLHAPKARCNRGNHPPAEAVRPDHPRPPEGRHWIRYVD